MLDRQPRAATARPRVVAGIAVAVWVSLTIAAAVGIGRIDFQDSPTALYASDDAAFRRLEAAEATFGPDDADLVTLIEGTDPLSPVALRALGRYVDSLHDDPDVIAVASPLDARRLLDLRGRTLYLPIATEEALENVDKEGHRDLRRRLIEHPAIADRLISSDGRSLIVVATLGTATSELQHTAETLARVRSRAADCFKGLPVRVRVTGAPALRTDTFHRLKAGLVRSTLTGGGVLLLIAALAFPRVKDLMVVLLGPATGVIWWLGMIGWSGARLDGLNVVLPSVLFAIGFCDSVHLRLARAGRSPLGSLVRVGPACFYTSLTTAVGFSALQLSTLESVQRFGLLAAAGTAVQCLTVTVSHAVLALYAKSRSSESTRPWFYRATARGVLRVGVWAVDQPCTLSAVGIFAVTALAFATRGAEFDMSWSETLPARGDTKSTLDSIDKAFGGSVPARLIVRWPTEASALDPAVLESLKELTAELHEMRQVGFPLGVPTSVLTLADALAGYESEPAREIRFAWGRAPEQVRRFLAPGEQQALITIPLPDLGATCLTPLLAEIETRAATVMSRRPGFSAHLTGTPVVIARNLSRVARELTASVMFAGVAVVVILGLSLQSVRLGLATIVPNLLPLATVVSVLEAVDSPLRITVALTLCFAVALGVDDTIHLASSLRRHRLRGATPRRACLAACRQAGPAIAFATLVLVAVLMAIALSDSPAIRSFGLLSGLSLVVSALSAIVLLPAYAMAVQPVAWVGHAVRAQGTLSRRSATA